MDGLISHSCSLASRLLAAFFPSTGDADAARRWTEQRLAERAGHTDVGHFLARHGIDPRAAGSR